MRHWNGILLLVVLFRKGTTNPPVPATGRAFCRKHPIERLWKKTSRWGFFLQPSVFRTGGLRSRGDRLCKPHWIGCVTGSPRGCQLIEPGTPAADPVCQRRAWGAKRPACEPVSCLAFHFGRKGGCCRSRKLLIRLRAASFPVSCKLVVQLQKSSVR